ncbi:hypothetical protein A9Q86_02510 [Flavobacteriales bacterium 33_180_T64]|nr:hypothetical protein A9Q86_02510 [Flavobacteriales bacterium 33_180_T64]
MKNRKRKDIIIVLLILSATFGYFLDRNIVEGITEIDLLFFKIGSFGFDNIKELIQYTKMKVLIIILSLIWYFTCRYWWKSSILVIVTIELLKLMSVFYSEQVSLDEIEYAISLPLTIPIILLLIFISYKLNDYYLAREIHSNIDKEIDIIFFEINQDKKNEINLLKEKILKTKKANLNRFDENYLKEMIVIRDEFYKI